MDIAIIALIIAIVSRRAWTSISALALSERGYGQNSAARERADELISQGYTGYLSGHTHHPELHAHGDGFYGNTGSCTSVVEAIDTIYGMPPVYLRTQQLSWLEITPRLPSDGRKAKISCAERVRADPRLPRPAQVGAGGAAGRDQVRAVPRRGPQPALLRADGGRQLAGGPDWPAESRHLKHRHLSARTCKHGARRAPNRKRAAPQNAAAVSREHRPC